MEKITSRDGTSIAFYRDGNGTPLLLVQGTGAAKPEAWPATALLKKYFNVITLDRRGRGESGDHREYSIEREAEDIAAVADAAGKSISLLGHSYGGLLALEAALLTPLIQKLVLYEPSVPLPGIPPYPEGTSDRFQSLMDAGDPEGVLLTHYREVVGFTEKEVEQLRFSPAWADRIATAHTLPRESRANEQYRFDPVRFKNLSIPALVLVGGESPEFLRKPAEAVHNALPNSRLTVLPEQRHIAMYKSPELFVNKLIPFLT